MKQALKVALARILDDLIKADHIIDTGEMDCWHRLCRQYGLDRDILSAARRISLADAVRAICDSDEEGLSQRVLDDCRSMTVSDGFCAHSEALLIIALCVMLDNTLELSGEIFSIPRASFNIDLATALYIESDYDRLVNRAITGRYRSIFKELQLAGFHFVYIPSIIDHYRHTDPELFKSILSFIAPTLSEAAVNHTYASLLDMTTDVFCKDLLCNKCGITALRNTPPSLLIKIGNSFVGDAAYANYLRLDVDDDIESILQLFTDRFTAMRRGDIFVVSTSEERDNQFHFHGFYKQLLDIFLVRRDIRSSVRIDLCKDEIVFPEIGVKASGLHRRERALYALLLCRGNEGLNFTPPRTAEGLKRFNRRLAEIQRHYAAIYSMLGGDRNTAPDLSIPEIRRPILSCLRRSLGAVKGLYNPEDYTVVKEAGGTFTVHLEPDLVYVIQPDSPEPVPLSRSRLATAAG